MTRRSGARALLIASVVTASFGIGCTTAPTTSDDAGADASALDASAHDAARDGASDGSVDATAQDAGSATDAATHDGGSDMGADVGTDMGTDAGADMGTDTGIDMGTDTGTDTGIDTGTDVGTDMGGDSGCVPGTACVLGTAQGVCSAGACTQCNDDPSCVAAYGAAHICVSGSCVAGTCHTEGNYCLIGTSCVAGGTVNPAASCESCMPATSTSAWSITPGNCRIGSACYASGDHNPSNYCQVCTPSSSTTTFSNAPTTTQCAASDNCHTTGHCNGSGACSWPVRTDGNFNSTQATALQTSPYMVSQCGAAHDVTGTGLLGGSNDVDWFVTQFSDSSFPTCSIGPSLTVDTSGNVMRACVYAQCTNGTQGDMSCSNGATLDDSIPGYSGCCSTGINVSFDFAQTCACSGFACTPDESANVNVRVDQLSSTAVCSSYSFAIHF
jgi:hypothetical protein